MTDRPTHLRVVPPLIARLVPRDADLEALVARRLSELAAAAVGLSMSADAFGDALLSLELATAVRALNSARARLTARVEGSDAG